MRSTILRLSACLTLCAGSAGAGEAFVGAYAHDVHVFATGVDGRMHQAVWNAAGGWAGWYDLDGGIVGPPEVLTYDSDIHIFAVGTDKHLHQKVWSPANSWSGWYDHQGTLQ